MPASWLVTIVIVGGMIGVAAAYLSGPRHSPEPGGSAADPFC